jgi:hypothetical protein
LQSIPPAKETLEDRVRWTAHPILGDVFQDEMLATDNSLAKQFADIVAGKSETRPKTVEDLSPIIESIEVLLAAGDVNAAECRLRSATLKTSGLFPVVKATDLTKRWRMPRKP